jgi:site-specific DNA-cytosine methylase
MLAIDLFCGLGGWTQGLLAEGWDVIGFDIERHQYGDQKYPAQLVLQDVLTLHGSQFRNADLIVASPPCQAYSYRAMPWRRAKALPPPDNSLFEACFRIQREACEAAGHHIPMVVENVRGAQKWVGRAAWNFGSYYLWGDVPALMVAAKIHKINGYSDPRRNGGNGAHLTSQMENEGRKLLAQTRGLLNFDRDNPRVSGAGVNRKAASAQIAKIPRPLSEWIAQVYKPERAARVREDK